MPYERAEPPRSAQPTADPFPAAISLWPATDIRLSPAGLRRPTPTRPTPPGVLGIIALAGGATCLLPILVSPFAWFFGAKAKREMMAEPQRWGGQGEAQAGFVMGIIGTVLLALGVVLLIILALFIALVAGGTSTTY